MDMQRRHLTPVQCAAVAVDAEESGRVRRGEGEVQSVPNLPGDFPACQSCGFCIGPIGSDGCPRCGAAPPRATRDRDESARATAQAAASTGAGENAEKTIALGTVAPAERPTVEGRTRNAAGQLAAGPDSETVSDTGAHSDAAAREAEKLRAINRAPEPARDLYRADLLSKGTAVAPPQPAWQRPRVEWEGSRRVIHAAANGRRIEVAICCFEDDGHGVVLQIEESRPSRRPFVIDIPVAAIDDLLEALATLRGIAVNRLGPGATQRRARRPISDTKE